jgi:hypothetical protein
MFIYTPFTYLIGWSSNNTYYYGVRYAKTAHPSELWTVYKTSSPIVKKYVEEFGDPDILEVRKTFDNAESARDWETKVLCRINAAGRSDFLNQHNLPAPPTFSGDENPSKRQDVRKKLSDQKKINNPMSDPIIRSNATDSLKRTNIEKFLAKRQLSKNSKVTALRYFNDCVALYPDNFVDIQCKLLGLIEEIDQWLIDNTPSKEELKLAKGRAIAAGKLKNGNKKWYHDPITLETRPFKEGEQPSGWVLGMIKNTPNNNTPEVRNKLSKAQKEYRANESEDKKNSRLAKFYDTINERRTLNEEGTKL